jgi:MFS family permease
MIRQHGMDVRTAGISIGIGVGLATAIGATAGGLLSDLVGRRGLRWRPLCIAGVLLAALPLFAGGLFAGAATLALVLLSAGAAVNSMQFGPTFALIQGLVQPAMRGTTTSLSYLANNLIGYGCGPLLVGVMSDRLHATAGPQSLRFALCAVMVFQFVGIWLFWRASHSIEQDARRMTDLVE